MSWADEIIVVDSQSTDRTVEIAEAAGAVVKQFHYVRGEVKKKNWALDNIPFRNDWILIVDADERITAALAAEISDAITNPDSYAGFYINRKFYFLNRFIRHAGYYPSWNLRLLKRGYGTYEKLTDAETESGDNEVHEHVILNGPAGELRNPMEHFAYPTIDRFIEKHMRYSNWEARVREEASRNRLDGSGIANELQWRRRLKRWGRKFPFPHWLRFVYHYFIKLGFLDGKNGYIFCHLLSEYEFWTWAKGEEARTASAKPLPTVTGSHLSKSA